MKIIHVFHDEKFIDPAIKLIESVYPNRSRYFVLQSSKKPYEFVKSSKAESLLIRCEEDEVDFVNYININNIKVVFFHALCLRKQRLVNAIDKKIIKVWFIWGADLYTNWPLLKRNIYDNETSRFLNRKNNVKSLIKDKIIFNNFSFWLFLRFRDKKFLLLKKINNILENNYLSEFYIAAQQIDIVVPVVPNEYDLIKKINIKPILAPFNYICIEDVLGYKTEDTVLESKNILIGNSADPSNNHLSAFKKISKLKLEDRKIIVPLSYGGSKDYIEFILAKGKYYFGENFVPLIDFMPLHEYNQLVSSCGFIVFNHIRQQAVGNIIAMAYMGAKIFLNEKSPVFEYYQSLGVKVFGMKELNNVSLNSHLNFNQFVHNKHMLAKAYSRNAIQNKIKELFNIVIKESINRKKNSVEVY